MTLISYIGVQVGMLLTLAVYHIVTRPGFTAFKKRLRFAYLVTLGKVSLEVEVVKDKPERTMIKIIGTSNRHYLTPEEVGIKHCINYYEYDKTTGE